MESELCETALTGQQLNELLSKSKLLHVNGHHIKQVDAEVIGVGQGFTSKVLRIKLTWSDQLAELPKSVVVKVIGSNAIKEFFIGIAEDKLEKLQKQTCQTHNIECKVYDLKGLDQMVPMAKCYAKSLTLGDKPGIIVLEDLSDRGMVFKLTDWGTTEIGLAKIENVIKAIASVHAWSVNNTEWRKVIPTLYEVNVLESLMENLLSVFPLSKASYPELLKDLDEEKLHAYVNKERQLELLGGDPKVRYNLPLVLVHGDMHVMNWLFKREDGDQLGDELIAIVDWQLTHQGCGLEDVIRLLLICYSTTIRREHGDELLRLYVETFNSKLNNVEDHITYENVKKAYNEIFPFYSIMWTAGLGILDQFVEKLTFKDEEQKKLFKEKTYNFSSNNYLDALKLLNW